MHSYKKFSEYFLQFYLKFLCILYVAPPEQKLVRMEFLAGKRKGKISLASQRWGSKRRGDNEVKGRKREREGKQGQEQPLDKIHKILEFHFWEFFPLQHLFL
jgi:hypothetical protein